MRSFPFLSNCRLMLGDLFSLLEEFHFFLSFAIFTTISFLFTVVFDFCRGCLVLINIRRIISLFFFRKNWMILMLPTVSVQCLLLCGSSVRWACFTFSFFPQINLSYFFHLALELIGLPHSSRLAVIFVFYLFNVMLPNGSPSYHMWVEVSMPREFSNW